MSDNSRIPWTNATWNPVTGCTKISPGCRNCYAEKMTRRLHAAGLAKYREGFKVATHPDLLGVPHKWKKPRMVFVCSMGDPFHEDVPDAFITEVFDTMRLASRHTFQLLTKRSERLRELAPDLSWPSNVWAGVTVEGPKQLDRIDDLRSVPAAVRFLSMEPLLKPVPDLELRGVDWVIVGGESGPGWRPMDPAWATQIRDRCVEAGVPFFFKQHAGFSKKRSGRLLDDRIWDEMPTTTREDRTTLHTIGFTQKSAEEFFSKLVQAGIRKVIDVRLNNSSQLAGFTKAHDLEFFLSVIAGIDYVHLPAAAPTKELLDDWKKGRIGWDVYEQRFSMLLEGGDLADKLGPEDVEDACLLCSEPTADRCHRRLVAEHLNHCWGGALQINHL